MINIVDMSDKDFSNDPEEEKSLLLSGTSSVNLMCLATSQVRTLEEKLENARKTAGLFPPVILSVAQIELSFLLSKECVSCWYRSETSFTRNNAQDFYNPRHFILVQVDKLNSFRTNCIVSGIFC